MGQPMSNSSFDHLRETQPYTPQPYQTFDNSGVPPRRFPWGCLLGGCGFIVLIVLVAVCGSGFWVYSAYQEQLAKYTSETPIVLPSVNISAEETEAINKRLEDFREQFEAGEAPQELVLTIDEINALIASNPSLKDHVYVSIEDEKIKAQVSFPTDNIPLAGKGRYFNGSATLKVELVKGNLIVTVVDAEANGQKIPDPVMKEIRQENLAKGMYENPETARTLQRCESLEIQPDRIVLKVRQKEPKEKDPPAGENQPQNESVGEPQQSSSNSNSN
jgi:hypothetical protein